MGLEWAISHPDQLVMAVAKGHVSPKEIEDYFHGVGLEGGISYAKMFLLDSASMLSDENIRTLGRVIERYALTDRIGPVAIVATSDAALTAGELLDACRRELAGYKRPKGVLFVAEERLPRSTTGKILRHEIEKWPEVLAGAFQS